MKTREFTIKTDNLEFVYDVETALLKDYIIEDLEIPEEFLTSINIEDDTVNIKLAQSRVYFNDDWYVNLQRVS